MRARIRGTEIFFDVDGAGSVVSGGRMRERPTALLVHGGPGIDHTSGKARYGALTARMQLVYFDQRGHGRSARDDPEKYTLDESVEDMEALRHHLGLGPIVSIGTSYGGRIAMAHAARYPAAVSHLVLIATAARSGAQRAKELVRERGSADQVAMYDDLLSGKIDTTEKMRRYFEVMGPLYSRKHDALTGVGLGPTQWSPQPLQRAYGPRGFLQSLDLRPELHAIRAPTLVVAGRYDWICAPELAVELHERIAGSELHIFEDSSHNIAADEPQRLLDTVIRFLVDKRALIEK